MAALVVMEALPITRPQTQVTDLLDPECQVPRHDPRNTPPQPCDTRSSRRKISLKYFPRISLRQIKSKDSNHSSQMGNGALQQNLQVRGPPQERQYDGNNRPSRIEPPRQDDSLVERQNPGEEFGRTRPPQLPSSQINGRKTMLSLFFWKRLKQTRDQGESGTDITAVPSEQPQTNSVNVQNITISGEVSGTTNAVPLEQGLAQRLSVVSDPIPQPSPVLQVQEDASTQNIKASESEPDTEIIPVDDLRLFSPETSVFVGHLYELPPPSRLEAEWRPIRAKLIKNIRKAVQTLPLSVSGPERTFEPELCMSGQARPGQQNVTLRPTIWIRCGSQQCQKAVQGALSNLSYTKRFPVYVTQYAPRPAGSDDKEHTTGNDTAPLGVQDEILPHLEPALSNLVRSANGSMVRIRENDFIIRVQPFASNHGSACGLIIEFQHYMSGKRYTCKLGGLVCIDDRVYGLTTAHALCSRHSLGILAQDSFSSTARLSHGPPEENDSRDLSESTSYESWMPAKLWAARYGVSPHPSESGTSQASSPTNEDSFDFALLEIDLSVDEPPRNRYLHPQNMPQHIIRHSTYLKGRSVSLVCSYEDVRPGQLLDGDRIFVDENGCWETRKIQMQAPLGAGASGTWVVDGSALLGIIIAVYDNEPYAHMLPIASVFSGIDAIASEKLRRSDVRVADVKTLRMYRRSARPAQDKRNELSEASRPDETLEIHQIAPPESIARPEPQLAQSVEQPPKEEVDRTGNRERAERTDNNSTLMDWAFFVVMCISVFTISLDSSAFPIIMPAITDTFNSTNLIGWYGGIYLLVYGTTFPNFTRHYCLLLRQRRTRRHFFLLFFASVLAFQGGLACHFLAHSNAVMLLGRSLCGFGAAGTISGTASYLTEVFAAQDRPRQSRTSILLSVYAFSRFLGPLFAISSDNKLPLLDAWRMVFLILTGFMLAATFLALLQVIHIFLSLRKLRRTMRRENISLTDSASDDLRPRSDWFSFLNQDVAAFILACGALVCLGLGLYYGAMYAWRKSLVISLFTAGTGGCFILFIVNQVWNTSIAIVLPKEVDTSRVVYSLISVFLWGVSYHSFSHYLPFWLRIVRGCSPLLAGITYLPTAATYLFAGVFLFTRRYFSSKDRISYSLTSSIASLGFMALGAGLISRFSSTTSTGALIGLQMLFSVGAGLGGFQTIQAYYRIPNNPGALSYLSLVMFTEMVGGFVGISAAQTVFWTQLSHGVRKQDAGLQTILHSGATNFKENLSDELRIKALEIFNDALTKTFFVSTAAGALTYGAFFGIVALGLPGLILLFPYWIMRRRKMRALDQPQMMAPTLAMDVAEPYPRPILHVTDTHPACAHPSSLASNKSEMSTPSQLSQSHTPRPQFTELPTLHELPTSGPLTPYYFPPPAEMDSYGRQEVDSSPRHALGAFGSHEVYAYRQDMASRNPHDTSSHQTHELR